MEAAWHSAIAALGIMPPPVHLLGLHDKMLQIALPDFSALAY